MRRNIPLKYERKTFSAQTHIIKTPKYKIYRVPKDVYTHDNKFVCHLEDEQFDIIFVVLKWPSEYYKKKVDAMIDGHPQSFEEFANKRNGKFIDSQLDDTIKKLKI